MPEQVKLNTEYWCFSRKTKQNPYGVRYRVRVTQSFIIGTETKKRYDNWALCECLEGELKGRKLIARLKTSLLEIKEGE